MTKQGSATQHRPKLNRIALQVRDEYSRLAAVLVHRPGKEIDRLDPDNRQELLFEDIPYLSEMSREHDGFTKLLRAQGIETLHLADLLGDILEVPTTRTRVLNEVCATANAISLASILNESFSPRDLSVVLLAGITARELEEASGIECAPSDPKRDFFILKPIPNAYFTRDPAVVIGNKVVICKPHYEARYRESILIRYVLLNHPRFSLSEASVLFGARPGEDRPYTIEGGDVIVLSSRAVAVGASQRTRPATIRLLAKRLFEEGLAERVYEVPIPAERKYMHLDTVFTVVAPGIVVAYPDVVSDIRGIIRYEPLMAEGEGIRTHRIEEKSSFNAVLRRELGTEIEVCQTGGSFSGKYASREQQADGTNMFAIAPGVVVAYNRTEHTNERLRQLFKPHEAKGYALHTIAGSELVRGLGGPRCMTMPLRREPGLGQ